MINLETLEQKFLAHVRGGPDFRREWCAQGLVDSDIGLAIYANAYPSRLREALEADHPQLSVFLGDALWAEFCSGYIKAHPSKVRSLRYFGAQVPGWLSQHPPFAGHPVISELAAFERELLDVFDSADCVRVGWSELQSLDSASWPGLRLKFHPSVRLLPTRTNAVEIWRALKESQPPADAGASSTPARLLWRDEERVSRFRPVESEELVALRSAFLEQQNFATLCEQLSITRSSGEVPVVAIGFLRQWFDEGIISALDVVASQ